jgi:asparagine synthase (glutamine-hydrolysing)
VMRAAQEAGVKVMLDGQGGDELFAGYMTSYGPRLADLLTGGEVRSFAREFEAFSRLEGIGRKGAASAVVRSMLPTAVVDRVRARRDGATRLLHPELRAVAESRPEANGLFPDRLRRHLELDLSHRQLPELLRYEDRNSMAHSIEARVPFLDHRLVELAFSLEGSRLISGGLTKVVLREALRELLPAAVRARTDKIGFVTPEASWFRGPLGELAAEVIRTPEFAGRGFVDAPAALERLEAHRRGNIEAGFALWRVLNLELWARFYLDP